MGGLAGAMLPPPWLLLSCAMGILVVLGVLERLINTLVSAVWYMLVGFDEGESKHGFGSMQVVTYTVTSTISRIIGGVGSALASAMSGLVSWVLLFGAVMLVTGLLYMAYEEYPVMARGLSLSWNAGVGPILHQVVVGPVEVLSLLFKTVLPLLNGVIWIAKRVLAESVIMPMIRGAGSFLQALTETGLFAKTLVQSFAVYFQATFWPCGVGVTTTNSTSTPVDSLRCVSDFGPRTLDLITPLSHIRQVVGILLMWLSTEVCGPLAVPLDVLTAPIMDINFAKGLHNLINSVLWTVLQVPIVTEAR